MSTDQNGRQIVATLDDLENLAASLPQGGLPSGGDVGDVVTNTAPGAGEWAAPTGGGVALLADPGNVWEAETAVTQGYRIIGGIDEEKVFEAGDVGTTGTVEPDFDAVDPVDNAPQDGDVFWLFIGYVATLPFDSIKRAEFVANGSTVDQLRDSLIAAGQMKPS